MDTALTPRQRRFSAYALGVVLYNLGVILWGAFVRATGSGAGCGEHWPTCNGEIVPRAPELETIIEFTHRATSGLALLSAVVLLVWAMRVFPRPHVVRRYATASMIFMLIEAAVGAVLVLLALTAQNDSIARAWVMGAHLINTFLLVGALTLTAWTARGHAGPRFRGSGVPGVFLGVAVVAMLALGASGGVTALGDTLFPAGSLAEGVAQDFSPTAHILVRLRVLHPLMAVCTAGWLIVTSAVTYGMRRRPSVRRAAAATVGLVVLQLFAGVVNLLLLAPVWLQLVHLLLADLVWMAVVLLGAAALGSTADASAVEDGGLVSPAPVP